MEGVHLSLLLLTAEQPSSLNGESLNGGLGFPSYSKVLGNCVRTYSERAQASKGRRGLERSYSAVISTSQIERKLTEKLRLSLGKWHPVAEGHMTSGAEDYHQISLDMGEIAHALNSFQGDWNENESEDVLDILSYQIHALMDDAPTGSNEYVVMDVHWAMAGPCLTPPSSAVALFGALLRMKAWHRARIEMIIPDDTHQIWLDPLNEWKEGVGVAKVWSASEWAPQFSTIWRGHINITEHKNSRQSSRSYVSFPDFALNLSPDTADSAITSSLLEGVGIQAPYCPSHLELLQVVDISSVSPFWVSPLQCQLSLPDSAPSSSVKLFNSLFHSQSRVKNHGYTFCFCQSSTNPDPEKISHHPTRTTMDWVSCVHNSEDHFEQNDAVGHPLWSYESGPILLVLPDQSETSGRSCDAWFLWKPNAIATSVFSQMTNVDDDGDLEKLHKVSLELKGKSPHEDTDSLSPFSAVNRFSNHCSNEELNGPPSDWKEIRALKTHEWIQRKMIKRVATSDLTFSHMPAPPPASYSGEPGLDEVLGCFTEQGLAADTEALSPIAVTTPSKPTRIHKAEIEDLTYDIIANSTPTSKRQYHGVGYCFTDEDTSKDSKLTKIQERYLRSERGSHCTTVFTPQATRELQRRRKRRREVQLNTADKQVGVDMEGKGIDVAASSRPTGSISGGECGTATTTTSTTADNRHMTVDRLPRSTTSRKPSATADSMHTTADSSRKPSAIADSMHSTADGATTSRKPSAIADSMHTAADRATTSRKPSATADNRDTREDTLARAPARRKLIASTHVETSTKIASRRIPVPVTNRPTTSCDTKKSVETKNIVMTNNDRGKGKSQGESDSDEERRLSEAAIVSDHQNTNKRRRGSEDNESGRSVRTRGEPSDAEIEGPVASSLQEEESCPVPMSPILMPEKDNSVPLLRKSPRIKAKEKSSATASVRKVKDYHLGDLLKQTVVAALKEHGMSRKHFNFRECYTRLFNLSKMFMKDVKFSSKSLKKEMKNIVELNAHNVIIFQQTIDQKREGKDSGIAQK